MGLDLLPGEDILMPEECNLEEYDLLEAKDLPRVEEEDLLLLRGEGDLLLAEEEEDLLPLQKKIVTLRKRSSRKGALPLEDSSSSQQVGVFFRPTGLSV